MERILNPEERIRRAEEVYYRRRMHNKGIKQATVSVGENKEFKLFNKVIIQISICIIIYTGFYVVQNKEYIFSENIINKTKEILSYDINFSSIYSKIEKYFSKEKLQEENNEENNQGQNENTIVETLSATYETGEEESNSIVEEVSSINQMEIDANTILSTKSLVAPLMGTITSRYGVRNPTTETVPKYHTGIDIATDTGKVIVAAMEGVVELVSSEGDYGNHIKIVNGDTLTLYAHCNKIYVKKGENIKQGQEIAEVGATGNVTGPHLHFEIRQEDRYVNPDLILSF